MIKALVFDMDGLLLDSEPIQHEAVMEGAKSFGVEISEEEYKRKIFKEGLGTFDVIKEKRPDADPDKYFKVRTEKILKLIGKKLKPMPHAIEFLDFARKNFKTALVTITPKIYVVPMLDKFGIREKFDIVLCREDFEKKKPDPEPYILAAKRLGMNPKECIVLEDTERGVVSAKRAGMVCIAVPNRMTKGLDFSMADMVVSSLKEIDMETINRF